MAEKFRHYFRAEFNRGGAEAEADAASAASML